MSQIQLQNAASAEPFGWDWACFTSNSPPKWAWRKGNNPSSFLLTPTAPRKATVETEFDHSPAVIKTAFCPPSRIFLACARLSSGVISSGVFTFSFQSNSSTSKSSVAPPAWHPFQRRTKIPLVVEGWPELVQTPVAKTLMLKDKPRF